MRAAVVAAFVLVPAIALAEPRGQAHAALLGDGEPYGRFVLTVDLGAVALSAGVIASTWAADSRNWGWSLFGMIPPVVAGPSMHFARGRWLPGMISFLGWGSVVASTASFGALGALLSRPQREGPVNCIQPFACEMPRPTDNTAIGIGIGIVDAAIGAIIMTSLDVFMARRGPIVEATTGWSPYIVPAPNGGTAGISATF